MDIEFDTHLESIHGIDIAFVNGDVIANRDNNDFEYAPHIVSLQQELQRLFDRTPVGSCLGDETDLAYGIDWDFVGTALDPVVSLALAKTAILQGLQHSSFKDRFEVQDLDVTWDPANPNALSVAGILGVFGFEGIELARFGPWVINYYTQANVRPS